MCVYVERDLGFLSFEGGQVCGYVCMCMERGSKVRVSWRGPLDVGLRYSRVGKELGDWVAIS